MSSRGAEVATRWRVGHYSGLEWDVAASVTLISLVLALPAALWLGAACGRRWSSDAGRHPLGTVLSAMIFFISFCILLSSGGGVAAAGDALLEPIRRSVRDSRVGQLKSGSWRLFWPNAAMIRASSAPRA